MWHESIRLLELEGQELHDEAAVEAVLNGVPAPRSPDALLDKLYSLGVGPDDWVIDLGCGHGQYAQQIASALGCKVVALDLSPTRVVETRAATALQPTVCPESITVADALLISVNAAAFTATPTQLSTEDLDDWLALLRENEAAVRGHREALERYRIRAIVAAVVRPTFVLRRRNACQ